MKLKELRELLATGSRFTIYNSGFDELLADIDAEIAKARGVESADNGMFNRLAVRVEHLERGQTNGVAYDARQDKRIDALEAGERELREHCQGNVPMSVFNDLKKRVDSLFSDTSSLENATTRELRELRERVESMTEGLGEDDAYKAWRREPWPNDVVKGGPGVQFEEAFRAGFRAGRK